MPDILEELNNLFGRFTPVDEIPTGCRETKDHWPGHVVSLSFTREREQNAPGYDALKLITHCRTPRELDGTTIFVNDLEGRVIAGETLTPSDRNVTQHWAVFHGLPIDQEFHLSAEKVAA